MKTIPRFLICLLAFWIIVSCSAPASPTPEAFQPFLKIFPLVKGVTWVYSDTEYDSIPNKPMQTIQAVYEVSRQVLEVKREAGAYLAEVRQTVKNLSADEGWAETLRNPPRAHTFWYIVRENRVYSVNNLPADLNSIDYTALTLEFQFPMTQDAQWCPNSSMEKNAPDFTGPTPYPCQYVGMRIIHKAGQQQTQVGSFKHCYQMGDVFNSGGIVQTFCDGAGIVAFKYDHGGTPFGFSWELTEFRR
jgi:hypothetical protein